MELVTSEQDAALPGSPGDEEGASTLVAIETPDYGTDATDIFADGNGAGFGMDFSAVLAAPADGGEDGAAPPDGPGMLVVCTRDPLPADLVPEIGDASSDAGAETGLIMIDAIWIGERMADFDGDGVADGLGDIDTGVDATGEDGTGDAAIGDDTDLTDTGVDAGSEGDGTDAGIDGIGDIDTGCDSYTGLTVETMICVIVPDAVI